VSSWIEKSFLIQMTVKFLFEVAEMWERGTEGPPAKKPTAIYGSAGQANAMTGQVDIKCVARHIKDNIH
jgi:hypothetical protein